MKIDEQLKVCCILKDADILIDDLLLVRLEKVHFNAFNAQLADTLKFSPSGVFVPHQVPWFLCHHIVLSPRVIPEEESHIFLFCISQQFFHSAIFHVVPIGIHQEVFPFHLSSEINKRNKPFIELWTVIIGPPAPGSTSGLDPGGILNF